MNKKYIVGGILIVVFLTVAIFSFNGSTTEFVNIAQAKTLNTTVQLYGHCLKDKETNYNSEKNEFTFYLEDEQQHSVKVILAGAKPNNFDIAPKLVVKGKYENGTFMANQILTKCPSKYKGTVEELKNS